MYVVRRRKVKKKQFSEDQNTILEIKYDILKLNSIL